MDATDINLLMFVTCVELISFMTNNPLKTPENAPKSPLAPLQNKLSSSSNFEIRTAAKGELQKEIVGACYRFHLSTVAIIDMSLSPS